MRSLRKQNIFRCRLFSITLCIQEIQEKRFIPECCFSESDPVGTRNGQKQKKLVQTQNNLKTKNKRH